MIQPEEILRKQLNKIASEKNLTNYRIEITSASSDGVNYMSVNYRAKIISPNRPDLNLFAKIAYFSDAMRAQLPIQTLYEREIVAYQLLSIYDELQNKYGIQKEDRYQSVTLYSSSAEYMEECLIMEDIGVQDYKLFDRLQPFTWEYAAKGVEQLAKFHALSLSLKKEYPDLYENATKNDNDFFISCFEALKSMYSAMAKNALSIVPLELKERVNIYYEKQLTLDVYKKLYLTSNHGIIVHGDYRASNILFNRQEGKIKGFIPIDYQLIRSGIPSTDLIYFIYTGTDAKFRKFHLKQLIDLYYNTFARFLRLLNLNPDQEFSRRDFAEEYKNHQTYGLFSAMTILPLILVDTLHAPKTTTADGGDLTELGNLSGSASEMYKERFMSILYEYIEHGLV